MLKSPTRTLLFAIAFAVLPVASQAQDWRLNVKNADINEFVEQVAEITGKTFVVDPRLKGQVTVISQTAMDADAVYALFLQVLRAHGFTASPSGNVIRIQQTALGKQSPGAETEKGRIAEGELLTRVIPAQNVASSELVKILRPLVPQYGHIAPIDEPNVVIVTDHADNIARLEKLIRQIDVSNDDIVQVLQLKEAWVGTVVALLEKLAPEQIGRSSKGPQKVQIIANERNNSMILRGKPRPIAEVLKLVDQLDKPATTAGSTQVIRLKHGDAKNVAEIVKDLVTSGTGKGEDGAQQPSIHPDESLNAIVVRADPGTMSEILDIVADLDVRRSQVLIEAAIVEHKVSDNRKLGVELGAADGSGESVPFVSTALDGTLRTLLGALIPSDATNAINTSDINVLNGIAAATSPTFAVAKIDANAISFGAVVNALATNSDANLLSTPSLMTLDNQEAKIVVGNEVPFRTGSFTTTGDGSNNPFTTVTREDVGLQLTITPHVYDSASVRLEIAQEITNVVDSPVGSSGFADVVTSKREIETTVLANSNQTVVLGGLIQDDTSDARKKVPLLGNIPGLGVLFRSKDVKRTRTNLLVFLRPVVINSTEETTKATHDKFKGVWEVEITSDPQTAIDGLFEGKLPASAD
ncbi:MAG: type II secretion system secretin GspD [Pseudomonadales bacterium]|nr:type II secretion system secretin GspD [Pseudomonadales bacterium]MCP5182819.1 type II secretion system secretin GspD [Pseudomonadales bacterium]